MNYPDDGKLVSAIFITFSGNCRKALTFYQTCFGGTLQLETFERELPGYPQTPVIIGSLFSDRLTIYGSDLVHEEGRTLGNYMSVFLSCTTPYDRKALLEKLVCCEPFPESCDDQKLVEVTDPFDVRWILSV